MGNTPKQLLYFFFPVFVVIASAARLDAGQYLAIESVHCTNSLFSSFGQEPDKTQESVGGTITEAIQWISLNEALELNNKKKDKRPIFIYFFTDWCGWCKRMDATTFQNPAIVKYLNEHYYCVKFNAESEGPVTYEGKLLSRPEGARATHPFAIQVASNRGQIGYPTLAILDESNQAITNLPGYHTPELLDPILVYYAEGYYKDFDFNTFRGMYTPASGK